MLKFRPQSIANLPIGIVSRLWRGVAFNFVGVVFNQGSTLIVNIIVANLLGQATFGKYSMILNTMMMFAVIGQIGTGYTATKYVAEYRSFDKPRTGQLLAMLTVASLFMAIIVSVALFANLRWVAGHALRIPGLRGDIAISACLVPLYIFNSYLIGVISGLEAFPKLARALVISGISYVLFCSAGAYLYGLSGAIWGLLLSAVVQSLALAWTMASEMRRQEISLDFRNALKERAIIINFTLPGALGGWTAMPAMWLANSHLAIQPGGYLAWAVYSACYNLMTVLLFLPNILNSVVMALLNSFRGGAMRVEYRYLFLMNILTTLAIVLLGGLFFSLCGPFILGLFGKSFRGGGAVLQIMMLAAVPEALTIALNQKLQSEEKMWLSVSCVNVPRDALVVLLAYALIPAYGAVGLAIAYLSCRLLAFGIISLLVLKVHFDVRIQVVGPRKLITKFFLGKL